MKRLRNILPLLVILGGMLILFYPTISNFLIMRNASRAVNNYDASVEALSQEQYQKVLDAAHAYNEKLAQNDAGETDVLASAVNSASTDEEYNSLLNIDGDGMMGYNHRAPSARDPAHLPRHCRKSAADRHRSLGTDLTTSWWRVHSCGAVWPPRVAHGKTVHGLEPYEKRRQVLYHNT